MKGRILKYIIAFSCLLVGICTVSAAPVITSFSPKSGPTGVAGSTTVIITGTDFSSEAGDNIVYFGGVQATVTAATYTQLTVTAPSGATWQPISVNVGGVIAYSYSVANPFIPTFAGKGSITTDSFAARVDFTTGSGPNSVAIADLDGDGKPDLVVANQNSDNVSVFQNTATSGSITTGSFAANVDFATGTSPWSVAIGDLDGDGKPDIAVVNYTGNTVSVFRNTATSGSITTGSFDAKVDFATGDTPWSVAIGDLDGDGKPDLAVANVNSSTVSVFRNTATSGSITFASFDAKVDFATGFQPYSVAIGDLDGDGKPDLAVANFIYGAGTVSVLLNTSTSGSISFDGHVDFAAGSYPNTVAIGDLDGDGKPDLAVSYDSDPIVSVFRNTSTSGFISFAARVNFAAGDTPYSVAIGDLDGDGKPDLAVANVNSNTVSVFRNTATSGSITIGSFAARVVFATGGQPMSVAIGDLDGDGTPDMAVTNFASYGNISVLRNLLSIPIITSFSPQSGRTGAAGSTTVIITGTGFGSTAGNNIVYFGGVQATVTAATTGQLTVTAPSGATWRPISVTVGGYTGYSYRVANPFIPTFATKNSIMPGDFASKVDFATGSNPYSVAIGDLDGDGKPDLAVANRGINTVSVFRNTATSGSITTGSFASKVDFATGSFPVSVAIGDLDGDGKPDLEAVNFYDNTISVLRNTATSGSITTGSFASKVDFTTGSNPYSVAIGDLDGDGKPDLAVTNSSSSTVSVFWNTSTSGSIITGSFAAKVDFASGGGPYSVAIGDLDGDGKPDLAVANLVGNTVSVLRNTSTYGSISFAARVYFATGTRPIRVAIGDLDGDGKPDLAVTNQDSNTVSVLRNTATSGSIIPGSFAAKVDFATGGSPYSIAIGDLDGDGKPDLVVINGNDNTVSVLRNTATSGSITTGSFAAKVDFATGLYPNSVAIGDLDGDGKPDLAVINYGTNTVSVLSYKPSSILFFQIP